MKTNISKNDLILILIAGLFSLVSFYYWLNYNPTIASRDAVIIAKLGAYSSDVRWKIYGNFDWIKPDEGANLISGDQIYTGPESTAVINILKNNSQIVLHANSLITILEDQDKLIMDIQKGSFDIEGALDDSIQIKNNGQIQALPTTEKNLTVEANKKGPIKVAKKIEVLPTILSPKNNGRYDIKLVTGLSLSGFFSGTAQVATDAEFRNIVKTFEFSNSKTIENLELNEAKKYYLKISKADLVSETITFDITQVENINLETPTDGEHFILDRGSKLTFKWDNPNKHNDLIRFYSNGNLISEHSISDNTYSTAMNILPALSWDVIRKNKNEVLAQSQVRTFSFDYSGLKIINDLLSFDHVYRDPVTFKLPLLPNETVKIDQFNKDKSQIIKSYEINNGNVKLQEIGPGHHFLEVGSLTYPAKDKSTIEVRAFSDMVYFKGLRDKKNNTFSMVKSLEADKAVATLEVGYESGVPLKNQMVNLTINGKNHHNLIKNIVKSNNKYFEVTLQDFGEYCVATKYSDVTMVEFFRDAKYCFTVTQKKYFKDLAKSKDQVLNRDPLNKEESYNIFLPTHKDAKRYIVQIGSDDKINNIVYTGKSDHNVIVWKSKRAGIYYYRYKLVDKNNNESDYSEIAKLIFPISPFSDWSESKP